MMSAKDVREPWPISAAGDMIDTIPSGRIVTHAVWVAPGACASAEPPSPLASAKLNVSPAIAVSASRRLSAPHCSNVF
jgi:hypothetical protein